MTVTRECPRLVADSSLSGLRVARELDAIIDQRGRRPDTIVSDNGTEYTSNAILQWADQSGVGWHYIAPGKPMQNGFIESFNGRLLSCCRFGVHQTGSRSPSDAPIVQLRSK